MLIFVFTFSILSSHQCSNHLRKGDHEQPGGLRSYHFTLEEWEERGLYPFLPLIYCLKEKETNGLIREVQFILG